MRTSNCDLQIRFCTSNRDLQIRFCTSNCDLQIRFCASNSSYRSYQRFDMQTKQGERANTPLY